MLGGHDAAGAHLWMREQLLHIFALLFCHQAQDRGAAHRRKIGNGVRRFVWAHLFKEIGGALRLKVFKQIGARLWLQLFERLSGNLFVERVEDVGAVARRQLVDDRGEVGRMQLREAGVRHLQAHARNGGAERIHILPVDI